MADKERNKAAIEHMKVAIERKRQRASDVLTHLNTKGHATETAEQEARLYQNINYNPAKCPCKICNFIKNKANLESYSLAQTVIYKIGEDAEKISYGISPFRHICEQEHIQSPIFADVGRLIAIVRVLLKTQGVKFHKFVMWADSSEKIEDTYEHSQICVDFYRE